jgi:SAM-dependent methyltransferase
MMASEIEKAYFDYWNPVDWERANFLVAGAVKWESLADWEASVSSACDHIFNDVARARVSDPQHAVALEIGSGPGRLVKAMRQIFGRVIGIDISPGMVELSREYLRGVGGVSVVLCDGQSIPAPDESVDFVYSFICLQHVPSREIVRRYLAETQRVLKSGGVARLQAYHGEWSEGFKAESPMEGNCYTSPGTFAADCESCGLRVLEAALHPHCDKHIWVTAMRGERDIADFCESQTKLQREAAAIRRTEKDVA